jgi:hypothetical protein
VRPTLAYTSIHPTLLERGIAFPEALPAVIRADGGQAEVSDVERAVVVDDSLKLGATLCRAKPGKISGHWSVLLRPGHAIDYLLAAF